MGLQRGILVVCYFQTSNPLLGQFPFLETQSPPSKRAPLSCLLSDPGMEHAMPSRNTLLVEFWLYKSSPLSSWLETNMTAPHRQECGIAIPDTDHERKL